MGGIEFYPQKEFDEDMEDKSDNDKIRVSTQGCSIISFFIVTIQFSSGHRQIFYACFEAVECSPEQMHCDMFPYVGGDAFCCGGQR